MAKPKKQAVGVSSVKGADVNGNLPIILGSVAVVLALLLVALLATKPWESDDNGTAADVLEFQAVKVEGSPLPPQYSDAEGTQLNEATGTPAPSLSGMNFASEPVSIKADGKPKVITFFAHWCPHCQKEIPLLSKWLRDNASKYPNVEFYGVSTAATSTQANFPPSRWFQREKFTAPVLVDNRESAAANAFGLASYPYFVILDKDHKVLTRTSGEISMDDFEGLVKRAAATAP